MTEPTDALLPCPFCGEAAKHSVNSLYGDMSMASCKSCGATAYAPKWNRRAVLAKWGSPVVAREPIDRGDAVNLARNAIEKYDCKGITTKGIRVLAEAVLSMDAALPSPQPTQVQPIAQAAEPVAWAFKYDDGTWHDPSTTEHSSGMRPLFAAPQPVAREPLPKFLALKFHARRDKKATVTLLFPGHEAADAWVRGIKAGQHHSKANTAAPARLDNK